MDTIRTLYCNDYKTTLLSLLVIVIITTPIIFLSPSVAFTNSYDTTELTTTRVSLSLELIQTYSTDKLHLPLCTIQQIDNGNWSILYRYNITGTYNNCPQFEKLVYSDERLTSHKAQYMNGMFHPGVFEIDNCRVFKLIESIHMLYKHYGRKVVVHYIGDSISRQQYEALSCEIERLRLTNYIEISYEQNLSLQYDSFCDRDCYSNRTFYENEIALFFNRCMTCNMSYNSYEEQKKALETMPHWTDTIPTRSDIIIMNSGAWYSSLTAKDYLQKLKKINEEVNVSARRISKAGKVLVWSAFPPTLLSHFVGADFDVKHRIAEDAMANSDVTFIKLNHTIARRFHADPGIAQWDGIHFVNPNPYSLPTFVATIHLHTIVQRHVSGPH